MLKVSHTVLTFVSGLVWLIIGCALLPIGLNFILEGILNQAITTQKYPLLNFFSGYAGGVEAAALIWIACALAIGFLKGKYVFAKSVQRSVNRIKSLPNPTPIYKIYSLPYLALLGSMVFLGYIMKFFPMDIRGGIDVIIGSGLINGSVLYFRQAWVLKRTRTKNFS